jgi:cytidine deaminase
VSTETEQLLLSAAIKVRPHSYSPYSGYKVASAIKTRNGNVFVGVNVENASYGGTICAERAAIMAAVSSGERSITEILVLTDEKNPWPPCGLCRQVIAEFADPGLVVHLANLEGVQKTIAFTELFPSGFSAEQLKK